VGDGGVPREDAALTAGSAGSEFARLMRARKMTRSFSDEPLPESLIVSLLDTAGRAPSAGSSQGTDFLVLVGKEQTSRYWDITLPEPRRSSFRWQGLLRAPLIVVVYADSQRYIERYSEPDKAGTGLGLGREHWATPYWLVDASFAAMALQLAALDEGLDVLFFGLFGHADAVRDAFGVPLDRDVIGTIAIGHGDGGDDIGASTSRPRRSPDEIVHRGHW